MSTVFRPEKKEPQLNDMNTQNMAQRREFLKRALATGIYAAPIVMSFSSAELVQAQSGTKDAAKAAEQAAKDAAKAAEQAAKDAAKAAEQAAKDAAKAAK
jgi:hypothetical protein